MMILKKAIAVGAVASLFYLGPTVTPIAPFQALAMMPRCGVPVVGNLTFDSAFATPVPFIPCPTSHAPTPWAVIGLIAGTVSIMIDAAIVWHTQCRELTLGEAMTAGALPGVGIAINQQNGVPSACPAH
jgi:hypothetical protein